MPPIPSTPGRTIGWWTPDGTPPLTDAAQFKKAIFAVARPFYVLNIDGVHAAGVGGAATFGEVSASKRTLPVVAYAPAVRPERLGNPAFCSEHGIRFPLAAGSMANGISSVELVEAMGRAGFLAFFGAGGLAPAAVEAAINRLDNHMGDIPRGFNLIYSPNEPALEEAVADLYIRKGVRLIEASAFMGLTLPVLRYRLHGLRRDSSGEVVAPNRIIAKVSRTEVAEKFFAPPPEALLRELVSRGELTEEQARMAEEVPVAQDLTAEGNSGGHTDSRPLVSLLPSLIDLRDAAQRRHGFRSRLRVGAAGGVGTPRSAAAALSMGADYLMTGSVNQACVESGTSDVVREMLAAASQVDTAMAPSADMFELGAKVQILKRGTMFAMRAAKLYEIYRAHSSLDAVPAAERSRLEREIFKMPLTEVWERTRAFFQARDPAQAERAERDPKHRMALVFRWYLGQSSHWANAGEASRRIDYQIWCGPAMGAFNEWARGSALAAPAGRRVALVNKNILLGAAVVLRVGALRNQGAVLPEAAAQAAPLADDHLEEYLS